MNKWSLPWIYHIILWVPFSIYRFSTEEAYGYELSAIPLILIPLIINLFVLHPILSLACAKKIYKYTNGKIHYVFYQGIVFGVVFIFTYLKLENIYISFIALPIGTLLAILASLFVASLWGVLFPLIYFMRQKRKNI